MNDASPHASIPNVPVTDSSGHEAARDTARSPDHVKDARRRSRIDFLDRLIRDIDLIFYCELSILYYMDCSMLKFLMRALPHWFNFTPKPDIIPPIPPGQRQYIGTIFGTNITCMLLHCIFKPPAAGEATRGYLHGGWLIDFIGQQSPVSKFRLWSLDALCLAIQLLMLAVTLEKQRLTQSSTSDDERDVTRQDHDTEEAGLLRSVGVSEEDIDARLQRSTTEPSRDMIVDDERGDFEASDHPLDNFYTGEHVLLEVDIVKVVRAQWQLRRTVTAGSGASSSGMETAASIAGRRLTIAFTNRFRNAG